MVQHGLGSSPGTLDVIKASAKENVDDYVTTMINDNGKPRPTWAAVAQALKSPLVGYGHLAEQLPPHTACIAIILLCECISFWFDM